MSSYYSVVQYSPDPASGERVNIGVIVVSDSVPIYKFLTGWSRVSKFSSLPKKTFESLTKDLEYSMSMLVNHQRTFGIQELRSLSSESIHNVTFSEPRGSTLNALELLEFASRRFLVEPSAATRRRGQSKKQAIHIGKQALTAALSMIPETEDYRIVGREDAAIVGSVIHHCDYGVKNGVLKIGGFGLSLDRTDDEDIEKQLYSIYAIAMNLRENDKSIPLGVVLVGNEQADKAMLDRAEHLLLPGDVSVIFESQAQEWAYEQVEHLVSA